MTTKEEILDYATNTPENTNRNVLNSMLDSYGSGSSSGGEGHLIVHLDENYIANKTFGEIEDALQSGRGAMVDDGSGRYGWVCACNNMGDGYTAACFKVIVFTNGQNPTLSGLSSHNTNATASDYPDFSPSGGGNF